jgi:hypothetical protein
MNRSLLANKSAINPPRRRVDSHLPPTWVSSLVPFHPRGDAALESFENGPWTLLIARVDRSRSLSDQRLRSETSAAYERILERLNDRAFPVRFWNFIPAINGVNDEGLNRYMAFNQGRFDAFNQRVGNSPLESLVPTASGVGHDGEDLLVYCLASNRPGRHFSNPRQIAPHRYSKKYGPLPPCFARATCVVAPDNSALLLVGGTASICGEDTLHVDDLGNQIAETLRNLSALVHSVNADPQPLARFRELRVYYPEPTDLAAIRSELSGAFPSGARIEYVRADLCRPELLVEIEGVAAV